jgi:hypothetical protein
MDTLSYIYISISRSSLGLPDNASSGTSQAVDHLLSTLSYTTEATPIGEFTSSVTMTTGSQNEITTDYSITTDAEIASTSLLSTATTQDVANTQLNTNSQEMTSTDKTEHTTETPSDDGAISSTTNPVCV